ncbi:RNA exonuclease 1 [Pelomyxa schiedti]|nr:RNA exonuclease 1 [Pelomyxa schiedti]
MPRGKAQRNASNAARKHAKMAQTQMEALIKKKEKDKKRAERKLNETSQPPLVLFDSPSAATVTVITPTPAKRKPKYKPKPRPKPATKTENETDTIVAAATTTSTTTSTQNSGTAVMQEDSVPSVAAQKVPTPTPESAAAPIPIPEKASQRVRPQEISESEEEDDMEGEAKQAGRKRQATTTVTKSNSSRAKQPRVQPQTANDFVRWLSGPMHVMEWKLDQFRNLLLQSITRNLPATMRTKVSMPSEDFRKVVLVVVDCVPERIYKENAGLLPVLQPDKSILPVLLPKKESVFDNLMVLSKCTSVAPVGSVPVEQFLLPERAEFNPDTINFKSTQSLPSEETLPPNKAVIAIQCEMVKGKTGLQLARITLVDQTLQTLLDTLVKPEEPIEDCMTSTHGISEDLLSAAAFTFEQVQNMLLKVVSSEVILVGHNIESILNSLKVKHSRLVDVGGLFISPIHPVKESLEVLALTHLHISNKPLHSVDAAIASMKLLQLKISGGTSVGISLLDWLEEHQKNTTYIDSAALSSKWYGNGDHKFVKSVITTNDAETTGTVVKLLQDDTTHVVLAHLQCYNPPNSSQINAALSSYNESIKTILGSTPPNSFALVITTGAPKSLSSDTGGTKESKERVICRLHFSPLAPAPPQTKRKNKPKKCNHHDH